MSVVTDTLTIHAEAIQAGDQIVCMNGFDCIPLTVSALRRHDEHGLVVADYTCCSDTVAGSRTLVARSEVTVIRAEQQEAH